MKLLEAAIQILEEEGRPMTAEALAEVALERKLVSRASEASMEKALMAEFDAGGAVDLTSEGFSFTDKPMKTVKPAPKAKKAAAKAPAKAKRKARAAEPEPAPAPEAADDEDDGDDEDDLQAEDDGGDTRRSEPASLVGFQPAPDSDEPAPMSDSELADDDEDALHERIEAEIAEAHAGAEAAAEPLSPEEEALTELYAEDLSGAPAKAHAEFSDQRTADEDRPMMPEINAREERHKRWEQRRDERKRRREEDRQRRADRRASREGREGEQPRQNGGQGEPAPMLAAPIAAPMMAPPANGEKLAQRVGNSLGDAAWAVFSAIRSNQPMPVKQLAHMMRKRGLLQAEPDQMWPHLKAALIGDERSYRTLGLRPRIVYRGRDLFAVGPVAQSPTASAEAGLAAALSHLAVATHKVLKDRICHASQAGFERLAHGYLVATGHRDIDWVKRVPGISYGVALPPDGSSQILVGARSGDAPVDRRGVGELRVGVEAKGMLSGLLLSGRELSEDAEHELARPGRSIAVVCGDAFVGALLASGVGVVTAAAPVRYLDEQLLDELLAG